MSCCSYLSKRNQSSDVFWINCQNLLQLDFCLK
ncbi:hypothetical protein BRAO375_1700015 [Bradyrhizobium sp. ORS 375]|nr:hypothetical protein BRAO375_1700015 [Bradyrhizobium sp. ORS 375]